jgi:hypothetical protein
MRVLSISVLLLLIQHRVICQVKDSVTYYINFAGTGNINETNSGTSYIFNNALKFNINKKILNINTTNSWIYGENNSSKTNNDFLSVLDVDLFKNTHRWYYWALAGYEKSFSLKINDRVQTGLGVGFNALSREKATIVLTDGILYEASYLSELDVYGRNRYETLRNSFRLKYKFKIRDFISIDGVNFLQNSFSDKDDYIIRSTTNLSIRLYKWLSFTAALTYNKLNLTDRENLLFNYGLMIEKTL